MIRQLLYKWFKIDEPPCASCEILKMQLGIVNNEKERLLQTVLSLTQPKVESAPVMIQPQELKRRAIPWNVQRQMLEAEDRKAAQVMAQQAESIKNNIAKLEEEVGIRHDEAVTGSSQEDIQPRQQGLG